MVSPGKILNKLSSIEFWFITIISLVLWMLLIYSNSFNGAFVMDDTRVINDKISEQTVPTLGEARSFVDATFAFNYSIGGLDTFSYHVFNYALHSLNSLLVIVLVLCLFSMPSFKDHTFYEQRRLLAVSVGFLFASHPLQTMAVTYIIQRYVSVATMWYLLGVLGFIFARHQLTKKNRNYFSFSIGLIFTVLCYLLGMHSKLIVATLPVMIFLFEWIGYRKVEFPWKYSVLLFAALGSGLAFVGQYFHLQVLTEQKVNSAGELVTPLLYAATQCRVFLMYIFKIVFPIYQNVDYHFPLSTSWLEPWVIVGLCTWLLFWIVLYKARKSYPLLSIGLGWFLITPLITSTIIPLSDVINEYRMYLPMFGAMVIVAAGSLHFLKRREWIYVYVMTGLVLISGVLTFNRNFVYESTASYWRDVIVKSPEKARGYVNYAVELHQAGDATGALYNYQKAIAIDPERLTALANTGVLYTQLGNFENANLYFDRALAIDPDYLDALNGKGVIFLNIGEYDEAKILFSRILEIEPTSTTARDNLKLIDQRSNRETN